jgi:hypothetical protein
MDSALGVCGAEMRAWLAAQGDADEDRSWVVRGAYRFTRRVQCARVVFIVSGA